jgi:beta-galactosidase
MDQQRSSEDVKTLFNDGWEYKGSAEKGWTAITLPHDAMLSEGRREDALSGSPGAWFLGGSYTYRKMWEVPASFNNKVVALSFDGVYKNSYVLINGQKVGGCSSGWTKFEVRIDRHLLPGRVNTIEVYVDNANQPTARWYTGSGIHRSVYLMVKTHDLVRHDGIRLATLSVDNSARLAATILLNNPDKENVRVSFAISRPGREVICWQDTTRNSELTHEFEIPDPALWSADVPNLYACTVHINDDVYRFMYGIRTINLQPGKGFLVNGRTVLLRGACVHADNGILGAVSLKAAEARRLRLLKATGFNAVRMSHHPCSEDFLQACDEIGLYVMDEYADYWYQAKSANDEAANFQQQWRSEIASMIERARNHASVIMYSLGNEVLEPKTAFGHRTAKRLLDYQHELDPTRPNTIAVNLMLATLTYKKEPPGDPEIAPKTGNLPALSSTSINAVFSVLLSVMEYVPMLNHCNLVTEKLYSYMDIAGYNYGSARYEKDARLHPNRMMLGTETTPPSIPKIWNLVEQIPNLIGDFTWVGWDYIGETGIGEFDYNALWYWPAVVYKPWPYLTAGTGCLDIIGTPNGSAFVAQAAWKVLSQPIIAVRPLDVSELAFKTTPWRTSDAIQGWGWKGREGQKAYIEVISQEQETELLHNGRSLGRKRTCLQNNYTAKFTTKYKPGELVAIAYSNGKECSRSALRSATDVSIQVVNEMIGDLVADGQDLAFLRLEIADSNGNIEMNEDDELILAVDGDASLAALGSANAKNLESFTGNIHRTWRGRALAAIRSGNQSGDIVVTVTSKKHGSASITIRQTLQRKITRKSIS